MSQFNPKIFSERLGTPRPAQRPPVLNRVDFGAFRPMQTARKTSFFLPVHYEKNYAYPLIVWLHTPGEDESQLMRVLPMISLRNYAAVAIRGAQLMFPNGALRPGFHWAAETYEEVLDTVLEAIDQARSRLNIASKRIYLVGSEDGGTMAQRLAFLHPHPFCGVASLDGAPPEDILLLERWRDLREVRFLYAVSRASKTCPADELCSHLGIMHSAGLDVTLRSYPTAGSLQIDMLRDVDRWIMGNIDSVLK
ncbi:MAG: hypothetical protein Q4D38_13130 [Planctomycetia bacterium]|nr:hypothetical protein [Planctomycetia bacterium]